jgi:hypothetical protein
MQETDQPQFEWNDDTLQVDEDGDVEGQAWYGSFSHNGTKYDVSASVTSYDFEQYGETQTNHVPHVVVTTIDASIVSEPHVHDSRNPQTAIERAKETAKAVVAAPQRFID